MENLSRLVTALKAAAAVLEEEHGVTWTGSTFIRTVSAEEAGTDQDLELLYFQMQESGGGGALYWVDESGMDEMTDGDMQEYLV